MCDVEYEAREGPGEALGKVRGQVEQKLRHVSIAWAVKRRQEKPNHYRRQCDRHQQSACLAWPSRYPASHDHIHLHQCNI